MPYFVRPSTQSDARIIAPILRKEDAAEIDACIALPPQKALGLAIKSSVRAWTACDEKGPFGLFGVGLIDDLTGSPWMLSSERFLIYKTRFLRDSSKWIADMHSTFPLLTNVVDARNTVHIQWLRWLGFTFIKLHEHYGRHGLPFYEFVRIK